MPEREYKEDVKINKYALDAEWVEHASVFMYWAEKFGEAKAARVDAEEKLKIERAEARKLLDRKRAELDLEIRSHPGRFGFDPDKKPTEAAITQKILLDETYVEVEEEGNDKISEAIQKVVQATRDEEVMFGARIAMGYKKNAIEGLTTLMTQNYYPRVPPEAERQASDASHRQHQERLNQRRRRRRE